jgi:hypothetical protein
VSLWSDGNEEWITLKTNEHGAIQKAGWIHYAVQHNDKSLMSLCLRKYHVTEMHPVLN